MCVCVPIEKYVDSSIFSLSIFINIDERRFRSLLHRTKMYGFIPLLELKLNYTTGTPAISGTLEHVIYIYKFNSQHRNISLENLVEFMSFGRKVLWIIYEYLDYTTY